MTIRTDAIVLRHRDLREQDRIYTLYTREMGKVEALARGARKIKSRMAGHLASFGVVDVMIARGRGADTLAGTDVIESYPEILYDPARLETALAGLSLLDLATKVHVRDHEVFGLLQIFLASLTPPDLPAERGGSPKNFSPPRRGGDREGDLRGALAWFSLRLFSRLGYEPMTTQCVICRVAEETFPFFDPRLGGVVCADCKPKATAPHPITPEALHALRALQCLPYPVSPPRPFGYVRELVEAHLEAAWQGSRLLA